MIMLPIRVVGLDIAFANFGMARAEVNFDASNNYFVTVTDLKLLTTKGQDKKTVRKSSDDLRRAKELLFPMQTFCTRATIAFAEVPSGSQQARSSLGLGIAVGVLASCPVPVIQVSQLEVKLATVGYKTATKDEMIEWAVSHHPDAPWLRSRKKELLAANEHLADAIATIYAGTQTDEFKRMVAVLKHPNDGGETARKTFKSKHFMQRR